MFGRRFLTFLFLLSLIVPAHSLVYVVKSGDTLWNLARSSHLSEQDLIRINELVRSTLFVGQKLFIPSKIIVYSVQAGDNLTRIANHFHTKVQTIITLNNLSDESIYINQTLKIPVEVSPVSKAKIQIQSKSSSPLSAKTEKLVHRVKAGETLSGLCQKYKVSQDNIQKWNRLNRESLYAGETLVIYIKKTSHPEPKTLLRIHTVRSGETLSGIARKYQTSTDQILKDNKLSDSRIYTGQKLKVNVVHSKTPYVQIPKTAIHPLFPLHRKSIRQTERTDRGVVIYTKKQSEVRSMNDGKVEYAGFLKGYEDVVIIRHSDHLRVVYGHLSRISIQRGQSVRKGESIGQTGHPTALGHPLYLEFRQGTHTDNPMHIFSFLKSYQSLAKR